MLRNPVLDRIVPLSRPTAAFALTAAFTAALGTAQAQFEIAEPAPESAGASVVVLTKVPKPWYAPRALVVRKFKESIPEYDAVPGLAYKYYTLADDDRFGGLYLWQSREQAQAWFNPAWFARVRKERGVEGTVRYFDAPVVVDNTRGIPTGADGKAVATIVRLPIPAGASRDALVAAFVKAAPGYRAVAGLARKYFVITDDGGFGGIYLWQDRQAAEAFYSAEWQAKAVSAYGAPAQIEWLDAPVILPSKLPASAVAAY
jgi:heme-degrading monooxygenase HmoA